MNAILKVEEIIRKTTPRVVIPIGSEDCEEIIQEGIALSLKMIDGLEKSGGQASPGTIAYYAIQQLKSGRRSYYSGRKQILSAAYQLDNGLTESLDVENEDGLCNVDLIPSKLPDPYEVTSLKLDWKAYLKTEPRRNRKIIFSLAKGFKAKEIAEKLKITEARLSQIRSDIARSAKAFFNDAACSHHVAIQ